MESITHQWAKIKSALTDAQHNALHDHGHSWDTFNDLERETIAKMGDAEYLDTPYGRVQRKPEGPVTWTRVTSENQRKSERLVLIKSTESKTEGDKNV